MDLNINLNASSRPKPVPNQTPDTNNCKLAIIGDSPGQAEIEVGMPFVGPAGQLLDRLLTQANIRRSECIVANVCQYVPPRGNIKAFDWRGPEIQEGLDALKDDLDKHKPNLCLLLGNTAMRAAGFEPWMTVHEFRGSILKSSTLSSPLFGYKCIPTYHPSAVLRMWDWVPLMLHDIVRAHSEMETPELNLPQRTYDVRLTASQIITKLGEFRAAKRPVSLDIEGYVHSISCVSFSNDPSYAFIVPLVKWPRNDLRDILRAIARLLTDDSVPKVLQNSLYDNLALSLTFQTPIRNVQHDTMLGGWEVYPELPKSLGVLASINTREPAYKFMRKVDDEDTHHRYCCTDAVVTLEIAQAHEREMTEAQKRHYRFNVNLLKPLLYLELRGIRYDKEASDQLKKEMEVRLAETQKRLSSRLGNDAFNPRSSQQCNAALYQQLNFPVQHPRKKEGYGLDRTRQTSDVNALLKLCGMYNDSFLTDLLLYRKLEKTRQALEVGLDPDGRVRCSYNVVGTETGRLSCSAQTRVCKQIKVGDNLQTVTKLLRKHYIADPGMEFFQADLAGADGWTVAAHCASYGDTNMIDDYRFGLKPAKIVVLMQRHGAEVNTWSRDKIKEMSRDIDEEGPDGAQYFAAKVIQHGTSYKMGPGTMSNNVTLQSYKKRGNPIYVSRSDCAAIQELFFSRYPGIKRWHSSVQFRIGQSYGYPTMDSASGHIRTFFGRKGDDKTVRDALAQEPQHNTTYATNMAMYRLWSDPENRRPDGSLIIEPLHQVHDALCGQWPEEHRTWAIAKVKSYFQNPVTIAGLTFVIPFDGQYGRSWGEMYNAFD